MHNIDNPFNENPQNGILPDGCGLFERYYTNGAIEDLCGMSPDPNDYESPLTLFKKIYEKVNRIINAVGLKCKGDYDPSDEIFKIIHDAYSVKDAIELLDRFLEIVQDEKFDKDNLKLSYESGIVSLVDQHGFKFTSINIPEEQFLDKENTGFIAEATIADVMIDRTVIIGEPYLKLAFKVIDESGTSSLSYSYLPLKKLFNIYDVTDTNSVDLTITNGNDGKGIIKADLRVNDVPTCAIHVDGLGVYVEDLKPYIEDEIDRALEAESDLDKKIISEKDRAVLMENLIMNMINAESERAIQKENQLGKQIQTEAERANTEESQLHDEIQAERNRAGKAEGDIRDDLNEEVQRSTNKDVQLKNQIDAEIKRSTDKDNELDLKDEELNIKIDAEINRSTEKDTVLDKKIDDEVNRSTDKDKELDDKIKNKISSVTGVLGITATTDANKNVIVSGVVKPNDKVLSKDGTGFQTTLDMSISGKTITLSGINDTEISKITVPGDTYTFKGSDGVTVAETSGNVVTTTLVLDPDTNNIITKSNKGLFAKAIADTTLVDTTGGTKVLTTTANLVFISTSSQTNYIGINSTNREKITFFNNSNLEVLFSFGNVSAAANKFVKDGLINTIALPKKSSIEFVKRIDGWHLNDLYGYTYLPDLADNTRTDDYALIVKRDGTATIEEIVNMKEWDESILINLTTIELESRFPNVPVGFQLVAPTLNVIYEKVNEFGDWFKINAEKVI